MTGWRQLAAREPVRLRVYAVALAGLAVAVTAGRVSGDTAAAWAALVAAVLGVPAAVESARAQVTPTRRESGTSPPDPG